MDKKRVTVSLSKEMHEKIWQIHAETRKSLNSIIVDAIEKGISKEKTKDNG